MFHNNGVNINFKVLFEFYKLYKVFFCTNNMIQILFQGKAVNLFYIMKGKRPMIRNCLLYTSDAADDS